MFQQSLWFLCALGSAVTWGFGYAYSEKILKGPITPAFLMVITSVVYFLGSLALMAFNGQWKAGFQAISADKSLILTIIIVSLSYVVGTILIYTSVSLKNPTLANMIEITYPIFTVIFAYILYREIQINDWTALGALLIFSGIGPIYLKN